MREGRVQGFSLTDRHLSSFEGDAEGVLVWTASHPHGSMALSASQLDERNI
jgi:hypothetical protein